MQAWQISSAERLPTLILADRISGDERRLAFPTPGFQHSALAHVAGDSGPAACRVPEEGSTSLMQLTAASRSVFESVSASLERLLSRRG
jgi:hypothetical protein